MAPLSNLKRLVASIALYLVLGVVLLDVGRAVGLLSMVGRLLMTTGGACWGAAALAALSGPMRLLRPDRTAVNGHYHLRQLRWLLPLILVVVPGLFLPSPWLTMPAGILVLLGIGAVVTIAVAQVDGLVSRRLGLQGEAVKPLLSGDRLMVGWFCGMVVTGFLVYARSLGADEQRSYVVQNVYAVQAMLTRYAADHRQVPRRWGDVVEAAHDGGYFTGLHIFLDWDTPMEPVTFWPDEAPLAGRLPQHMVIIQRVSPQRYVLNGTDIDGRLLGTPQPVEVRIAP